MKVKEKIDGEESKLPRQSHAPRRLHESKPHISATAKDFFRCKYFEILDLAIQRLTRRISRMEEVIQEAYGLKRLSMTRKPSYRWQTRATR